jgi:hypothetical protein
MAAVAEGMAGMPGAREAALAVLGDLVERTELDRADLLFLYCYSAPVDVYLDVVEEAIERKHPQVPYFPIEPPPHLAESSEVSRWNELLDRIGYPGPRE